MCLPVKVSHPEFVLAEGVHVGHEWAVVQNGIGYRCGYIKVEPDHPWYGQDEMNCEVHGGITFSARDTPCDKGGPDDGWWIGFDCAHCGDRPDPSLVGYWDPIKNPYRDSTETIKTTEYVIKECRSLCEQAAAAKGNP